MPGPRGRYAPLLAVLDALPAEQASVRLTLAELDTVLGEPLSASAHTTGYWTHSDMARKNWRRLGWDARLSHADQTVTFTRQARQP